MVEDITGLGKLLSSRMVRSSYDDLLSGAMKESGKALTDLVKTFRLFTLPIQLLAVAQDRLAHFCEQVRASVPLDQQIEASPSIAIPILLGLRQTEDSSPLIDLYLNLLRRAIDKDRVGEAHPAFAKFIEQMSPDEAVFMHALAEQPYLCLIRDAHQDNSFPFDRLTYPELIDIYAIHLASFGLVDQPTGSFVHTTPFGDLFIQACVPKEFVLRPDVVADEPTGMQSVQ